MFTFQCQVQDSSNHSPFGYLTSFIINNNVLVNVEFYFMPQSEFSHCMSSKINTTLVSEHSFIMICLLVYEKKIVLHIFYFYIIIILV